MLSINPIFQVLVTNGNLAVAAAGLSPSQLAVGQIGIFSYATNLSIDGTVLSQNRKFYLAVGVNRIGTSVTQDLTKSAGEYIDKYGIRAFSIEPYQAPVNETILITIPNKLSCNTEYGVKFEIRNAAAYANYGYNTPYKSFFAKTPCCTDPCTQCGGGDANAFVQALAADIALDPDHLLSTAFIDPNSGDVITNPADWLAGNSYATPVITSATGSTTGGAIAAGTYHYALMDVTVNGFSALSTDHSVTTTGTTSSVAFVYPAATDAVTERRLYIGASSGVYTSYVDVPLTGPYTLTTTVGTVVAAPPTPVDNTGEVMQLQITVLSEKLFNYALINLKYDFPRQTVAILSFIENFDCGGQIQSVTPPVYEQGSGYDIKQMEYEAGGWNGKPGVYRISELVGTEIGFYESFANPLGQYNVYNIMNDNKGIGGGAKYESSMMTTIAVPTGDTTTIPSLSAALHRIIDDATGSDGTVNGLFTTEFAETFE